MNDAKILLVDDEEELRRSTAQALELSGFSVETYSNGDHVLELIGYSFPGVVVSDIRMPGIDGMTLMQKIRELDPEVPVILVTGHGDVQLAVKAMREGAYDFIEKPFTPEMLMRVIRRAMERRGLVLENRLLKAVAEQARRYRGAAAGSHAGDGGFALPHPGDRGERCRYAYRRRNGCLKQGGCGACAPRHQRSGELSRLSRSIAPHCLSKPDRERAFRP